MSPNSKDCLDELSRLQVAEERLRQEEPDYVIVLPWNILSELREQLHYIKKWDGKFVTCTPALKIH